MRLRRRSALAPLDWIRRAIEPFSPESRMNENNERRIAVYTGSFDPITLGHLHIIHRASRLFESLVIGIGINAEKGSLFSPEQRSELVQTVTHDIENVRVEIFDGLAVDFVRSLGSRLMVRGIRPMTDIAGEFTMMMANRQLDEDVETVFLMADERFSHVSSSLLKQIASVSEDDEQLAKFVPRAIIAPLRAQMRG
ncbi:Phosphopantetheine adenylyltransferase [Stieleria magnilauensis]|uniref:Phosphopantetheine adenylyltransferase n=2 Tax=Pirellulaceae TaxID=2691357 RepID=A0ABX5XIP6_9BACT|nr:Phosphopantetheine adenylyltransferase [Planctomycetes bacterium TBK1r]